MKIYSSNNQGFIQGEGEGGGRGGRERGEGEEGGRGGRERREGEGGRRRQMFPPLPFFEKS